MGGQTHQLLTRVLRDTQVYMCAWWGCGWVGGGADSPVVDQGVEGHTGIYVCVVGVWVGGVWGKTHQVLTRVLRFV